MEVAMKTPKAAVVLRAEEEAMGHLEANLTEEAHTALLL